ncbi:hypothetical protein ABTX81_33035 [Kitasatospora sp. NPDC097605]|uniref:hypothetical protein n=1 Tax=Kitasatospora sp. NPDC097605 TaxID=3157226 RepID=UPI0033259462
MLAEVGETGRRAAGWVRDPTGRQTEEAHRAVLGRAADAVEQVCGREVEPGAFAGAAALAQARSEGTFTSVHEAFWAAAREAHGEREGTRALIEVLLLHRQLPAGAVVAGMETVLRAKSCSAELVAIEARKAMEAPEEENESAGEVGADPVHAEAMQRLGLSPVLPGRDRTWAQFRTDLKPNRVPADGLWSNPADPKMAPVQAQQWTSLLTALDQAEKFPLAVANDRLQPRRRQT